MRSIHGEVLCSSGRAGDKLVDIDSLIDWEALRTMIREMYDNHTERGGRPDNDEIVMMKMLVSKSWHGLSDPELERQANDRISFHKSLDSWKNPDRPTAWAFRRAFNPYGQRRKNMGRTTTTYKRKGLKINEGVTKCKIHNRLSRP